MWCVNDWFQVRLKAFISSFTCAHTALHLCVWTEACESSKPTHICNLLSQVSQLLFSSILLPVLWTTPRSLKGPAQAAS